MITPGSESVKDFFFYVKHAFCVSYLCSFASLEVSFARWQKTRVSPYV